MNLLTSRLEALGSSRLKGMLRGLEKESLRVTPDGKLAFTPHPAALGSPLTHPHITTDFSESQLELVTGVHTSAEAALDELTRIHREVYRVLHALGDEALWPLSMPCILPTDENIPLGRYGNSNVGRAKSVYRMGLANRYGRRMQTISGIHYNWSLPELGSEEYFALIRNFRRHSFLLLLLFGASPAVCQTFVQGRDHGLQALGSKGTMHLPYATTLRMGRLGYQSEAQSRLHVSYNHLDGYAASLHEGLSMSYPPYEAIGIRNLGGEYNQLATTLLQIENEFYGTIRPKRVIERGERPLHALRTRGVQYVEVRLMDLNPFLEVGIDIATMHFLDVFLLHCLLQDSPPDTPEEIDVLKTTQHLTASRGREPGLRIHHSLHGGEVTLLDYAIAITSEIATLATRLDDLLGTGTAYQHSIAVAQQRLQQPHTLPSAQVLDCIRAHGDSFAGFGNSRTQAIRTTLLQQPLSDAQLQQFAQWAAQSLIAQQELEAADTEPFEVWRQNYISPSRLSA